MSVESHAPRAERRPIDRVHHGDTFADPYEWLRDKENPEVISHLEAENLYTEKLTQHLGELSDAIFGEIKSRTQETDLSVPSLVLHGDQPYWYYSRTREGSEYAVYCRAVATLVGGPRDPQTPPDLSVSVTGEEILIDGNVEAEGQEFFALGGYDVSADGRFLAYSVDHTGAERFTVRFKDLSTGELLADEIDNTAYGLVWAQSSHLFYTRTDDAWRPFQVMRHAIGSDQATDVEVYAEPDERFWVGIDASRDLEWLIISTGSKITSECRLLSAATPEAEPRVVAPRRPGVEYDVEPAGDRLLILHNDGAEDFALAQAPLDATSHEQWTTVLPHQPGVRLTGVSAYAGHVVISLRRDGLTGLHVIGRDTTGDLGTGSDIDFDEPLYTVGSSGSALYAAPTIRVEYTSLLTPQSVYDYVLASGELVLRKQTAVMPDPQDHPYSPELYVQERAWATADDGTQVPLSIVRRADVPLDGGAPALLYGYGSYEIPIDPVFAITRLSLLDRGVIFAIAHIRGGGELGRHWYDDGKTLTKKNTFSDFVAAGRYLVEAGYTSPERLGARGGSAGGLLMGAVANLAPELFRAIHADVPFVDALTTILDPELPLTVTEWDEWGDPLHDADVYRYMKDYTPYENIRSVAYPAILATTSLNDTRVFFVEPAKWVAQLRETVTNGEDRPILLKTEMVAGHGGVSGRYNSWKQVAFEYAWLIDQLTG